MKIALTASVLSASMLLAGCSSSPYSKEIWMNPDEVKIEDKQELQKVGYLARYLLPREEAMELDKEIQKSQWVSDATLQTSAGFAGSLLQTGNPLSTAGVSAFSEINAALTVASWMIPEDGIMEKVSGIYLPKVWDGESIDTQEQAKQIAIEHTEDQLRKTASLMNLDYSCIANCDSTMSRVYHLAHTPETDFSRLVYQAPGGVYVLTHWFDLVQPEQPNLIENASVGFDIGWKSPVGNTWVVGFYGTPIFDENDEVTISEGENGFVYASIRHWLNNTELGRTLYREFNNDGGYLFMGSHDQVPRMVAYNGKLYSYTSRRADRFIDSELVEKTPDTNELND